MATPYAMTLLDIVQTVNEYVISEDEVVATAASSSISAPSSCCHPS